MKTISRPLRRPSRFLAALLLAAVACVSLLRTAPAESPTPRVAMETLVKDMLKSWETGDAEKFASAFDDKAVFAYPGDRLDKPHLVEMFKNYHQDKTDIKIYFGRFLVEDNRFAMTFQFAATDRKSGARQAVGTAASGRVENGKLVLYKEFYDEHVAKRQAAKEIPLDEGHVTAYPYSLMLDPKLIN